MAQEQANADLSATGDVTVGQALRDLGKFLIGGASARDYERFGRTHFLVGLAFTWLVGIARNWDFPDAPIWARFGLASVAYVFLLSFMLWVIVNPALARRQTYKKFLTVVTMTAPPGLVYGIPVEMMTTLTHAQQVNLYFLLGVALWRVTLMIHFLCVAGGRSVISSAMVLLFPLAFLVIVLVGTGRAGYVMDIMGGNREATATITARSDEILAVMFCFAWPILVLGGLIYLALVFARPFQVPEDEWRRQHSAPDDAPKQWPY